MNDYQFVAKLQAVVAEAAGLANVKALLRDGSLYAAKFCTAAIYLARTHTQLSLKEIGELFGGRDHSTISVAVGREKRLLDRNAPAPRRFKGTRAEWHKSLLAQVQPEETKSNA
jgi:hypothetical protein